jgi:hypothetical protein
LGPTALSLWSSGPTALSLWSSSPVTRLQSVAPESRPPARRERAARHRAHRGGAALARPLERTSPAAKTPRRLFRAGTHRPRFGTREDQADAASLARAPAARTARDR